MDPTIEACIPPDVLQCRAFWDVVVPLIHFSIVEYHCADRVLRQFNFHQPIPRAPPSIDHIHMVHKGRFNATWAQKQGYFISCWEERYTRWVDNLCPIEAIDFQFNSEYYSWYSENGKPFIASVEDANNWLQDPRCSKHVHLSQESGPGQCSQEPIEEENNMDSSTGAHSSWSPVQSHPPNNCEQPTFGDMTAYQTRFTDDGGYIPQFQYPTISNPTISSPSYNLEDMYGTPPFFSDEQTPDQPRRMVQPPRRYDQTSSLHRQELPRRRRK